MLEDQVAYLLQRYLGNYVKGLNKEALKISVWQGDVELSNMQLKPEALNALKLPVKVKAGFLGSVKLKVPWSRLGQDPVLVYLDRIYLLAEPSTHVEGCNEDTVQEAKRNRILEMEMKLLETAQQLKTEVNQSWTGSFVNTIVGNLKLSISNIHIRYEDVESNPGHPFAAGVTLEKLSAVTVDDSGKEAFVTGGSLDRIKKLVELEKLALYLDADIIPWSVDLQLGQLNQSDWDKVFKSSIRDGKPADHLGRTHSYVLQPVSGSAQYIKLRPDEISNNDQAIQHAKLFLDDVTLNLSKDGYRDVMKLADNFAAFNQRLKYAHYRPTTSAKSDPRSWWKYAYKVISEEAEKGSGTLSWEHVLKYARLRKRYISLYASLLKMDVNRVVIDDNPEIASLDRELDIDLILQWRMLAHKFVEQSAEAGAAVKKQNSRKSWWSFGWNSQSSKHDGEPLHLSKDDWERLNNIIGYKETNDNLPLAPQDRGDVLRTSLEVHMRHNASKLIGQSQEVLAELSCDSLACSLRLYMESKIFDLKLASYQLSSPNGLIAESASPCNSLLAVFSYKPLGSELDWSMFAKASPCYITYLKEPIHKIINFFESGTAISRTVALETAAAVQMTIDEVKRTAQQQVNKALRGRSRFQLDLDIAAPKITVPSDFCPDGDHATKLLLDLGHLVIRKKDNDLSESDMEKDLYLSFDLVLSDVSAALVDGDYYWGQAARSKTDAFVNTSFLPVIDKCGVVVKLQQIRLESPPYPSTRLSVRLPSLCFHFSPARYHRLMHVSKIFQEDGGSSDTVSSVQHWDHADFAGVVPILVWKGREAIWRQKYLCLTGGFFYILEYPQSISYKMCISLRGKQICQVSPENVGGVAHVLAVCSIGLGDKVVEDVNSVVLRCDSADSASIWKSRLRAAVYRASGSAPISSLSDNLSEYEDSSMFGHSSDEDLSLKSENLFLTGFLDELKICFSCYTGRDVSLTKVLLVEESHILEFRAIGGQVEVSVRSKDIFIGTLLKSLEIEDLVTSESRRPCYLARSFIDSLNMPMPFKDVIENGNNAISYSHGDGDDKFYEVSENLVDDESVLHSSEGISGEDSRTSSSILSQKMKSKPANFSRIPYLLPYKHTAFKGHGVDARLYQDNFVKAQIIIYDQSSTLYENIDNQVVITLSTLSFFCRRSTVLAMMGFFAAISIEDEKPEHYIEESSLTRDVLVEDDNSGLDSTVQQPAVKGLLGKGKSRIVFNFMFSMARAQVFLVKDDETTLATLSQDNLETDIKVYPSSFSITASLGNLKVSDGSLHSENMYFWICDMRNPRGSSFVQLEFNSYCPDDQDFEGYDYSLSGKLSEVQIVYLNRFVQEVISYFTGLVPSNSTGVGKLYDHVTNADKWMVSSEIEGSPAVRLDLSFWKPIILMPQKTESTEFLKLDVVHITVQNTFQWIYGCKDDINAVHLEILNFQVEDINLNVNNGNELGESIIHDVKGISITVQRTLRDLMHQLPNVEASIEVLELKAALSSKEYEIIIECTSSNFSETPNIIPPLNNSSMRYPVNEIESLAPTSVAFEPPAQEDGSWLELKVSFVSNLIELRLHPGATRDTSLATVQAIGTWLVYKSDNHGEGLLSATLKSFSVTDDREGTREEFRLAIGKLPSIGSTYMQSIGHDNNPGGADAVLTNVQAELVPTMLVLDAKFNSISTFVCICGQRPQLLVALDFLLALTEFFYPNVDSILLNDEKESHLNVTDVVILNRSHYLQKSAEFFFSPEKPLIVDDERYITFVYDGNGGTLYLLNREGCTLISPSIEPMIYVADGKRLQFKNVLIRNGRYLDSCILLGANSSYSVLGDDGVYLEYDAERPTLGTSQDGSNSVQPRNRVANSTNEFTFELQAIGSELTFYNSSTGVGESVMLSNRLLHAEFDAFCRIVLKGDMSEMNAKVLALTAESNGVRILEPLDIFTKFSNASGKKNIHIVVSEAFVNFSFDILKLFLAVEEDLLKFLRTSSKKITESCLAFDRIGAIADPSSDRVYSFWRPRAPPGFATLGDYLTPQDKPPTKGVLSVNTTYVRLKRPLSFKLIWPLSASECNECFVWLPEAPQGYVALGCVVSHGKMPPPLSSVYCILASLVSPCALRDCITILPKNELASGFAFWRVDSSLGTFLPADPITLRPTGKPYELRNIFFCSPVYFLKQIDDHIYDVTSGRATNSRPEQYLGMGNGRKLEHVADFKLIWWNQGSNSRKKISIWRPVVPEGVVYFGDVAIQGYEPPKSCVVVHDSQDGLLHNPRDAQLVGRIKKQRDVGGISLWLPKASPGFVSLGCIACKDYPSKCDLSSLRCIRMDMVSGGDFLDDSLWDTSCMNITTEPFSIWAVDNVLGTFFVRNGFKKPPRRFAYRPGSLNVSKGSDDIMIDAEVRSFTASFFDDYGGLMVPLLSFSMNGIQFSFHGTLDHFHSAVSFSFTARGYNDKYDAWEPLLETIDGFLRYEYDIKSPGAVSQLRFTFSRELNFNISVSNANMIFQAYASWCNLTNMHDSYRIHGSPVAKYDKSSNIDIHKKKSYYIVPRNNLGQDIFLRITKPEGTQQVTRVPSGDLKYFKAPVLKSMFGSHAEGKSSKMLRKLVTVIIADAELPRINGLSSRLYAVAVRISSDQGSSTTSLPNEQSVRTCGKNPTCLTSSGAEVVCWNEMFFFKVDPQDHYMVEFAITDFARGHPVGSITVPLEQMARTTDNPSDYFDYINDLVSVDFPVVHSSENAKEVCGKIRCTILLSSSTEAKVPQKVPVDGKNSGFFEISPSRNGPWTTMRLNYAARFSCWRFGDHVVCSEVSSRDNNRYINFRSLVAIRNDTEIVLELRLELKVSDKRATCQNVDNEQKDAETAVSLVTVDEIFETERYDSSGGWISCAAQSDGCAFGLGNLSQELSAAQLPSGWEWVDDWGVDNRSVNGIDGWVYAPDVESLKWPDSYNPLKFVNYARQRRWIRTRRKLSDAADHFISVGLLNPGSIVSLPLTAFSQLEPYTLKVRPFRTNGDYSWSSVIDSHYSTDISCENSDSSDICLLDLTESEKLLYCSPMSGTSSDSTHGIWFYLNIKASVIAKDVLCSPIEDWCLSVKCPLSLTNFLPMASEFAVLEMQAGGNFASCCRDVLFPGTPVNIHTCDIRNPLYLSLLPQSGWLPVHDAVLISHPKELPSKGLNLRSSISGRIVQIILDQNHDLELPTLSKVIRIYAPYWFSISRCPPLTCKLIDLSAIKKKRKMALPFGLNKKDESVIAEIVHEETYDGYTITSALNFKYLGASLSVDHFGPGQFGPVEDLASLGNMDGQVEVKGYDAEGHCMRLYFCSKPCPFQSIPTKVVSIRPFITFTNRLGQRLHIKLSSEDEPKVLNAFDARVAFVHCDEEGPIKIQVQLEDTEWSLPFHVVKEDTLQLVLRKHDGTRNFLRTEIRGYEEGSRFVVVFRIGSTRGPIRIENRIAAVKQIRVCQSEIGNSGWIVISPLSTINFSWDDPYGPRFIDIEMNGSISIQNFELEKSGTYSIKEGTMEVQLHVLEVNDIWVACFSENGMLGPISGNGMRFLRLPENWEASPIMQKDDSSPLEVLMDVGILGISFIDHKPNELCYLYLERVSVLYSTGSGRGSTSRFKLLVGYMQLDNQLTLTRMPVLLAPEQGADLQNPVFKMSVAIGSSNSDGIMVLPHISVRVTEKLWRLSIHEPIIWAFVDFYNNLQLDTLPKSSNISQIDPEIRIDLVDVSEVRLKVALETAPTQRPHGVLGVWSPILSAIGSAFKIQVHIRRVMHKNRFMRRSTIAHAIVNRICRDLIHNPLQLIFSLDVLGIASSTLSSLSRRFAELSTDGQFVQLRTQQVRSRRVTGVGDGFIQGTEALAQGVAFGVSGVVTKPMESAKQNGLLGLAHGLGRAFLGFVVQPVSGALDLVSLTVYGIGASCTRCLEVFLHKGKFQRIRNPRTIRADCIVRDYSEEDASGQDCTELILEL